LTTPILYIRRDLGKPRLVRRGLLARGENERQRANIETNCLILSEMLSSMLVDCRVKMWFVSEFVDRAIHFTIIILWFR
jgi:hypothetical protein